MTKIEAYYSHSWKAKDVPLNVLVWKTIAEDCELYVDKDGVENGTYYINRLEELIRKSDVFISVLAYRDGVPQENSQRSDYQLKCSPAALFELRLAERARKPRWVIFDDRTGYKPPQGTSDLVIYTPIDADEEIERGGQNIRLDGIRWLQNVRAKQKSAIVSRSRQATLLIDNSCDDANEVATILKKALTNAGYLGVNNIEITHTDAEVIAILQASGLLVAEVGEPSLNDVYGMAHAMFVPSIRFVRSNQHLPRLLEGHPGGYQNDLIMVEEDKKKIAEEVQKRAEAMRDKRKTIEGFKAGCAYLRGKLYRKHKVFFSHNISTKDADLLKNVFELLEERGICAWEYRHNNHAGVDWKEELNTAIDQATDVVFILDQEFEISPACSDELDMILNKRKDIKSITPFYWGGRDKPNPKFKDLHFEKLSTDKEIAAKVIADRLSLALRIQDN